MDSHGLKLTSLRWTYIVSPNNLCNDVCSLRIMHMRDVTIDQYNLECFTIEFYIRNFYCIFRLRNMPARASYKC